jgi:hypothetical protein
VKRPSEAAFGEALRDVDIASIVYKPPDDARTWKPCDYMVWIEDYSKLALPFWFEVKDVTRVDAFPFSELRPAQMLGIRDAQRVGLPYWLAVYWRKHRSWTISLAERVLAWREDPDYDDRVYGGVVPTSIPRELLMSRFGVDATGSTLSSVLKTILLGEI